MKDCLSLLEKKGYTQDERDQFSSQLIHLPDCLRDHFGAGYEVKYSVRFRMRKVEAILYFKGENFDYLEKEKEGIEPIYDILMRMLLPNMTVNVTEAYLFGHNIFTVISPVKYSSKTILKSPLL